VAAVESPCVGTCRIDAAGLCEGCARTLAEIAAWGTMTPDRRRTVMRALPGRRDAAGGQPGSGRGDPPQSPPYRRK